MQNNSKNVGSFVQTKIISLEVKSSDDYSHKSLINFKNVFQSLVNNGIVLYDGDIKREGDIYYYPVFLLDWLF